MSAKSTREELLKEAWLGDAVLCLYARKRILKEDGRIDGDRYSRMTSNQFLSTFGEPSAVEARIGRIYAERGIEGAFLWIDDELMPAFERQEAKRLKNSGLIGTNRI